jgi:hypothetical protein
VPLPAPYAVILLGYGIWLVETNFTMSTPIWHASMHSNSLIYIYIFFIKPDYHKEIGLSYTIKIVETMIVANDNVYSLRITAFQEPHTLKKISIVNTVSNFISYAVFTVFKSYKYILFFQILVKYAKLFRFRMFFKIFVPEMRNYRKMQFYFVWV